MWVKIIECNLNAKKLIDKCKLNDYKYTGDLENENDVFQWMIDQKEDESIEEIDRETLFNYITSKDFLAVIFCKYHTIKLSFFIQT